MVKQSSKEQDIFNYLSDFKSTLSPEYLNSGLKDTELLRLLELVRDHLYDVKNGQNF